MLKQAIHATAWRIERLFDRLKGQRDTRRIIEPYIGYATPEHLIVRGRVLTSLRRGQPKPHQSPWTNFKQMFALFLTDEVANVEVRAESAATTTDEEGYFTLRLLRSYQEGWLDVPVSVKSQSQKTLCPVLIPRADAAFGIISDIDDTMMQTGAYSLIRNLWTTFTGSAATRHVFADAVEFINTLSEDGRNPVYYVSSSPWNLHHFLERVFDRAGLTKGPKFLRDLGLSQSKFVTGTHGGHKGASIDEILTANPGLPFVLVGDTGQHDAFVYRDALLRHGDRIQAIVLRVAGEDPDVESKGAMQDMEAKGAAVFCGRSFAGFAKLIRSEIAARANRMPEPPREPLRLQGRASGLVQNPAVDTLKDDR